MLGAAIFAAPLAASFGQEDAPAALPAKIKAKPVSRRVASSEDSGSANQLSFGEIKRTSGEKATGKKSAVRTAEGKAEDEETEGRVVRAFESEEASESKPKRKAIRKVAADEADVAPAQWTASRSKSVLVNGPGQVGGGQSGSGQGGAGQGGAGQGGAGQSGLGQRGLGQERIPAIPDAPQGSGQGRPLEPGGQRQLRANCGTEKEACEEARKKVFANTIDRIQIDLSPLRFSDKHYNSIDEYIQASERITREGLANSPYRSWVDRSGNVIIENARLLKVRANTVVVVDAAGVQKVIPISQLSEAEMCEVADTWGIPIRCELKEELYTGRMFCSTTFTWTASALCHKPNYFEQIELERYGHTPGPILEAPMSGVKFAADIATLPYKMGINPPNECKYALGYYRPGNCAPWIIPPVPLSLRGAIFQATAVTGVSWIIP